MTNLDSIPAGDPTGGHAEAIIESIHQSCDTFTNATVRVLQIEGA